MADALRLHSGVVVDDVVEGLQRHLHVPQPLPVPAGVHLTAGHHHQRVQVLEGESGEE